MSFYWDGWHYDYHNKEYTSHLYDLVLIRTSLSIARNYLLASVMAIYSVSLVDKVTYFCSLDWYDTTPIE